MNEIHWGEAAPEAQTGSPDRAVCASLGERYAYYRRCRHLRTNGEQCKAPAMKGDEICNRHAEQLEWRRRRAGQRREFYARSGVGLGSPRAIQKTLNELAREIVAGRMDRKVISRVIADLQIIIRLEKALRRYDKTKRSAQAGLRASCNSFHPAPPLSTRGIADSSSTRSTANSSAISARPAREAGLRVATRFPASGAGGGARSIASIGFAPRRERNAIRIAFAPRRERDALQVVPARLTHCDELAGLYTLPLPKTEEPTE